MIGWGHGLAESSGPDDLTIRELGAPWGERQRNVRSV